MNNFKRGRAYPVPSSTAGRLTKMTRVLIPSDETSPQDPLVSKMTFDVVMTPMALYDLLTTNEDRSMVIHSPIQDWSKVEIALTKAVKHFEVVSRLRNQSLSDWGESCVYRYESRVTPDDAILMGNPSNIVYALAAFKPKRVFYLTRNNGGVSDFQSDVTMERSNIPSYYKKVVEAMCRLSPQTELYVVHVIGGPSSLYCFSNI